MLLIQMKQLYFQKNVAFIAYHLLDIVILFISITLMRIQNLSMKASFVKFSIFYYNYSQQTYL